MSEKYPALDGVRGFAFFLVLLFHVNTYTLKPLFLVAPATGVWLFFVLSSFLIAGNAFLRDPGVLLKWAGWGQYFWRRFWRIYPLFLLYVGCLWFWAHLPVGRCVEVFLLRGIHAVDWSLYIECRVYFILPFLVLPLTFGLRGRTYVAVLTFLVALSALMFPFWDDSPRWSLASVGAWGGWTWVAAYLSCFVPGVLSAYAARHCSWKSNMAGPISDLFTVGVLGALLLIAMVDQGLLDDFKANTIRWWFPFGILFALWIYLLSHQQGRAARFLSSRPLRFLGAISYPGYLFHIFVYHGLSGYFENSAWGFCIASLILSIAVAAVVHFTIERPVLRWAHRHFSTV